MTPLDRLQSWLEQHRRTAVYFNGWEAEDSSSTFRAAVIRDGTDDVVSIGHTLTEAVEDLLTKLEA